MSKIDEYNNAVNSLNRLGFTLTNEQKLQLSKMLEDIICEEIVPTLVDKIAPLVSKITSPLTLVIEHMPGHGMSIKSGLNTVEIDDCENKFCKIVSYKKSGHYQGNKSNKEKAPATLLTIKFPDGTIICEKDSSKTMLAAIEKIGVSKVLAGGFTLTGIPIVSLRRQAMNGVFESGNYYVYTSASNAVKVKDLTKMSDALNLGLKFSLELKPKKGR